MDEKGFCGEYLAPLVKVVRIQLRQTVLSGSLANVNNPFLFGDEENL